MRRERLQYSIAIIAVCAALLTGLGVSVGELVVSTVSTPARAAGPGFAKQESAKTSASQCLSPSQATLRLAQGKHLCCCKEVATGRLCCRYVASASCPASVPGCGC
jgi:hypothetical protein